MRHRGEIIKNAIKKSGFKVKILAERLNKSRTYIYDLYEEPLVDIETMSIIGKIIGHDFSSDLNVTDKRLLSIVNETPVTYNDCIKQIDEWKTKYIDLLEKYNELLDTLKK